MVHRAGRGPAELISVATFPWAYSHQPSHQHTDTMILCRWRRSVVVIALALINVINRHWARLVLGWVTVCGRVNYLGM